jgi:hypothetical protein
MSRASGTNRVGAGTIRVWTGTHPEVATRRPGGAASNPPTSNGSPLVGPAVYPQACSVPHS